MASKKAGRLAGLAALAGLAYMANKKGETKDTGKSGTSAAETKVKDTAEDAKAAVKRNDYEETLDYTPSGNDAMYEKEPGFETKTTPTKVASVSSPASKPAQTSRFAPIGSPVAKTAAGIGNAKAVVAPGGDRSARLDMPKAGKTGNAKAVVAPGGDRSARTDASSSGLGGVRRPGTNVNYENEETSDMSMKKGGKVKKMASGGMTSSASKRGDGIAQRGKTKGRVC